MTHFRIPAARLARCSLLLLIVPVFFAISATAVAESGAEFPTVEVEVQALNSVSGQSASTLSSEILVSLARSDCKFRLAPPGSKAVLRLEIDLLGWQRRQEPGGAPVFDDNTGRYRLGAKHELRVRYIARIIEVASGKLLKKKETSFLENTETSKNPMYDARMAAGIRARSKLRNSVRRLLCKVARRYGTR